MTRPLTWSDWPARRRPLACVFSGVVIAGFVAAAAAADVGLGVLSAVILLGSTAEALLPTRFEITDDGVAASNPLRSFRRGWERFGAWRAVDDGVWIDGRGRARILRRRGVFLRRPPPEAVALVRARLGDPS
jgi:hypothetical protein